MTDEDIKELMLDFDDMINGALHDIEECKQIKASNSYGAGVAYGELSMLRRIKQRILTGEWGE